MTKIKMTFETFNINFDLLLHSTITLTDNAQNRQ